MANVDTRQQGLTLGGNSYLSIFQIYDYLVYTYV